MQRNFAAALSAVLKHEGGYVDHPKDPGGATNMGITHKVLAAWRKVSPYWNLPKSEIKSLTKAEAAAIYKANYWDAIKGDQLPDGLDYAVFDYAVNSGPARAAKALQGLVEVAQDGKIGPLTLSAVAKRDADQLVRGLCDQRMAFLRRLPGFETFGKGWTSRVKGVRSLALQMVEQGVDAPSTPPAPKPAPIPVPPLPQRDMKSGSSAIGIITVLIVLAVLVAAFFFLPIIPK